MKTRLLHSTLRLATLIAALSLGFVIEAAIPTGYYRNCSGKSGAELKTALHDLLYNHTSVGYWDLPQYFQRTDAYPPGHERYGQWWDMYGNIPLYIPSFSGMNREHSFPKSWWGGSDSTPAYVDINHLYPSEAQANLAKSNWPLGEVQTALYDNGVTRVGSPVSGQGGGAKEVFEPDNEYKGDFARTYFYMVTCYQNLTWKYKYMVDNNTYPTLNNWSQALLLKWSREDPVSQKEIDRNEQVYKIQANRNPFIDYPELAEYIWGNKKGQVWRPTDDMPTGDALLITPVQDMSLDFGQTAVGSTNTSSLFFQGENLRGYLEVMVSGTDRALFTPDATLISASAVNTESGFWLKINYIPTSVGINTARLVVSGGGLKGSRGIELRGEGCEVPVLHDFKALAASNVTATSYTANWEVPAGDVVDYYIVTRTVYNNGKTTTEDLVAETNELEITDCDPTSTESYNVRSARLGYYSARSNEVYVNFENGGLADIVTDNPLGSLNVDGGVVLLCGTSHYDVRVFDTSGRLVRMMPRVDNGTRIDLPLGAYFIVSGSQRTPVKVLVH